MPDELIDLCELEEIVAAAQAEVDAVRETLEDDDALDRDLANRRTACLSWGTLFMEGDA